MMIRRTMSMVYTNLCLWSPVIFLVLKAFGVYDFKNDSLVFLALVFVAAFTKFLTFEE